MLAHRDELIAQAQSKLHMVAPELVSGIVKAERNETGYQVTIASVQTLSREKRLAAFPREFDNVIVDEAHHAAAPSYHRVLEHVVGPETLLLGVSATLERSDKARLDDVFDQVTYELGMLDLMQQGYLCDLRALEVLLKGFSTRGMRRRHGDFVESDLEAALQEADAPEHAVQAYQEHAAGRKALLFAPTVASAASFRDAFAQAGIESAMVWGAQPHDERALALARFSRGEVSVLCNCMVLTEGFDEPSADCVIMARPTCSKPLYVQMLGRGVRTHPGKDNCLVLDLVGAASRIGDLMTTASLFGIEPQQAKSKKDADEDDEEGIGVLEAVGLEQQKQAAVQAAGELVAREVDLFKRRDLAWGVGDQRYTLSAGPQGLLVLKKDEDDLFGDSYDVVRVYREQGPYDRYPRDAVEVLAQGYDLGYAQGLAEEYVRQHGVKAFVNPNATWRGKPASEAQLKFAKRLGVKYAPDVTMGEISELIDQAKARKV